MKKLLILLFAAALASCTGHKEQSNNPLDVKFGDPYVLLASDGHYYMYGTGGVQDGFGCYRSDNLIDWEYQGAVYQGNTPDSWAVFQIVLKSAIDALDSNTQEEIDMKGTESSTCSSAPTGK